MHFLHGLDRLCCVYHFKFDFFYFHRGLAFLKEVFRCSILNNFGHSLADDGWHGAFDVLPRLVVEVVPLNVSEFKVSGELAGNKHEFMELSEHDIELFCEQGLSSVDIDD